MRSALFQRVGRYAAAPAGAALAGGAAAYLGQRGSANAAARTSSAVAAMRCSSTHALGPARGGAAFGNRGGLRTAAPPSIGRAAVQRRALPSSADASSTATKAAAEKAAPAAAKPAAEATAATAAKESTGGGGGGEGFLAWYESHLQSRPVPTKMVTGGLLWGLGDIVAQVVPVVTHPDETSTRDFRFDAARLGRASAFGFAIHAPIAHLHYNFLEWMTVRGGITGGVKVPLFKAFMEQFVYWSWFSNSLYHGAMGAMQGWTAKQCYDRIADVLWDTQKAQWAFWIPVQLVNFRYVPVRHQLNVVLLTSVVWTALLSAWYPPEQEEEKEKRELIK